MTEAERNGGAVIAVDDLSVGYQVARRQIRPVLGGVTLRVLPGERVGLIGESGSGKSTLGLALAGLLPDNARILSGAVRIGGRDLADLKKAEKRELHGREVGVVFQDAAVSLDPLRRVGWQVADGLRAHRLASRKDSFSASVALLSRVGINDAGARARQHPHELSGGMRQRAMIASGVVCEPKVLVADEPTSALDVTTQARVLDLIRRLSEDGKTSVLLITHDIGVVAGFADVVMVLYAGSVAEIAPTSAMFSDPAHPYTALLLRSYPRMDGPRLQRLSFIPGIARNGSNAVRGCPFRERCPVGRDKPKCAEVNPPLQDLGDGRAVSCHYPFQLEILPADGATSLGARPTDSVPTATGESELVASCRGIGKTFRTRSGTGAVLTVRAVSDVTMAIHAGESLGLIGESGSGKTTLGRILAGLETPDSGEMAILGRPQTSRSRNLIARAGMVQMVFQNPGESLDPHDTVLGIVSEPLRVAGGGPARRYRPQVAELLAHIGLDEDLLDARPVQLSGGQQQRVAIARAVAARPRLVIADEAVSALDMSIRGQVLNLLADLQAEIGFACIHISHDLSVVRHICNTVYIMRHGEIVEHGATDEIFSNPTHSYTQMLLDATPKLQLHSASA